MSDVLLMLEVHKHRFNFFGVAKPLLEAKRRGRGRRVSCLQPVQMQPCARTAERGFSADYASQLIAMLGIFERQRRKQTALSHDGAGIADRAAALARVKTFG